MNSCESDLRCLSRQVEERELPLVYESDPAPVREPAREGRFDPEVSNLVGGLFAFGSTISFLGVLSFVDHTGQADGIPLLWRWLCLLSGFPFIGLYFLRYGEE